MTELVTRAPRAGRLTARQALWLGALVLLIVAVDQVTKWAVRANIDRGDSIPESGLFRLVHYSNTGAAFGILQGAGTLLALTSIIGVVAIIVYVASPAFGRPLMRFGFSLMLAGALGNLIDRLMHGEVTDFLKVPNWPAFNVADSAISIGVLLLLWTLLRDDSPEPEPPSSN